MIAVSVGTKEEDSSFVFLLQLRRQHFLVMAVGNFQLTN